MDGKSGAKVIALNPNARRAAAHERDAQRTHDGRRQHPSSLPPAVDPAPEQLLAPVIGEVGPSHTPTGGQPANGDASTRLAQAIAGAGEFIRARMAGDYTVEESGFDPHLTHAVLLPMLRVLYQSWFRVEVTGVQNLPATGAALVVANHAGVLPLDGLMTSVAVHDEHPAHRDLHLLAADLVFDLPVVGPTARKAGHTPASPTEAHRLLRAGDLVAVFPEGFKGLGKPYGDRYKLQRFGRGGFVASALRARAPIVPCSIVGSEDTYPMIANATPLAKLLGLPYFPITPLFPLAGPLGLLPLPTKWHIEFGTPIDTTGYPDSAAEDPMVTFDLTDQVRETI